MTNIKDRIDAVRVRIDEAAKRSGRALKDISLVAVTKNASVAAILEAKAAGIEIFAENRIQDAQEKVPQIPGHLIGHLQSNKIKPALELFELFQSIDSVKLAEKIQEELLIQNRILPVLLEVNISGESQKHGFQPDDVYRAVEAIGAMTQIQIVGLMGIAPNTPDILLRRQAFKKLKGTFVVLKGLKNERLKMQTLSMGMSDDYEAAIEEGSNMVRLGRAIFGGR
jgi:hypothetical protein